MRATALHADITTGVILDVPAFAPQEGPPSSEVTMRRGSSPLVEAAMRVAMQRTQPQLLAA